MKKEYTHISMVIDRSGSMGSCWSDVTGGFAKLIQDQKLLDKPCTFTLVAFDNEYLKPADFEDIKNVAEVLDFAPRGSTALLDAVGKSIVETGEKLAALNEDERPEKVLFVIQTDGRENASREFTAEKVKELIESQKADYNWEFMFLSADLSSLESARSWGVTFDSSAAYGDQNTAATYNMVSNKVRGFRSATDMVAAKLATQFTAEEKQELVK